MPDAERLRNSILNQDLPSALTQLAIFSNYDCTGELDCPHCAATEAIENMYIDATQVLDEIYTNHGNC